MQNINKLIGLLVIFIAIAIFYFCLSLKGDNTSTNVYLDVGINIAETLFCLGLMGIIIDLPSWKHYFGQRITEVIINQDYLDTLDPSKLRELQISVFKSQFKNTAIDQEGSFLEYFNTNLHALISAPYRQDVSLELIVEDVPGNSTLLKVYDKVSYTCRKANDKIQSHVRWVPDPGEFEEIASLKITAKFPFNHKEAGSVKILFDSSNDAHRSQLSRVELQPIDLSLENFSDVDKLIITVESEYKVSKSRFQYWTMAHPTQNFDITIIFPTAYEIQYKPLCMNEQMCEFTKKEGYLKVIYDSWMLPQSGLSWIMSPRQNPTVQAAPPASSSLAGSGNV